MKNIGEVPLSTEQMNFISSMINRHGDGQHPVSDANTFKYFTIEYVKELTEKPEVLNGLNPTGLKALAEIKEILVDL